MKIAYIKCDMRPSTASVGGQHTRFTEPENTIFMYLLQPLTGETLRGNS